MNLVEPLFQADPNHPAGGGGGGLWSGAVLHENMKGKVVLKGEGFH